MKKFKFPLESVLKIRKIEMDQQAKALALAQNQAIEIREKIFSLKKDGDAEVYRLKHLALSGQINEQMTFVSVQYRNELKRQIQKKTEELNQALRRVEEERRKLVERQKKKKALENLEEKQRENHNEEQRKAENQDMDELAGSRWAYADSD